MNTFENLPDQESRLNANEWQALVYTAGYVGRKKKSNDEDDIYFCYEKYDAFTQNLNGGGLSIPSVKCVNGIGAVTAI